MIARILSEDPQAQGITLLPCPQCKRTQQRLSKLNGHWLLACECGKQSTGSSASQAMNRWNSKKPHHKD